MLIYTYEIEATFENACDDSGRVDTTVVNMEHQDIFIAVNHLIDEHYPAKLVELHCELLVESDEDE